MIPWIATFWLASIVVSAGYTPTLDVTETLMYNHPAFEYGPSWSMVFPESLGPVNGVHVPAGNGPAVYQSNSTSSASFSLPFYGAGVKNLALAVSPWDTTVASASVTLSLDSTTWTVSMKTTPSASLQGPTAVFPLAIDVGPQGLTSTSTQRVLKVSVDGNILASFLSVDIVSGFQTNANGASTVVSRSASLASNSSLNPVFSVLGDWVYVPVIGGGQYTTLVQSMQGSAGSRCTIQLPANTTYTSINGTAGSQLGSLTFSFSNPVPVAGFPATIKTSSTYSYQTSFYETPLDPTLVYNLTIAVGADGPALIHFVNVISSLNDPTWATDFGIKPQRDVVTPYNPMQNGTQATPQNTTTTTTTRALLNHTSPTYSPNDPSPSQDASRPNVGAIAGGVAGGMAALFIIGTLLVVFVRRRRRQSAWRNRRNNDAMEVDPAPVEPFVLPAPQASVVETGILSISDPLVTSSAPTSPPIPVPRTHADHPPSWDADVYPRVPLNHSHQSDHIRYHTPAVPPTEAEPPSYDPGWRGGLDPSTSGGEGAGVGAGGGATEVTEKGTTQSTSKSAGGSAASNSFPPEKQ